MFECLTVEPPLVLLGRDERVLQFAAAELVRYTAAAGGPVCSAVAVDPAIAEGLEPPAGGEPYRILDEPLRITAATPPDLLRAVYRHLEQRGWRWYYPGPLGEAFLPDTPAAGGFGGPAERIVLDRTVVKDPAFWHYEACRVIDWATKQGFTTLAIESFEPDPADVAPLVDELARRGLRLEVGGDIVGRLLAATRPESRVPAIHRAGERRARRLELAEPEAVAALPDAARAELARFRPADALRVAEPVEPPLLTDAGEGLGAPAARLSAVARAAAEGLAGMGRLVVWQPVSPARRGFEPPAQAVLVLPADRRAPTTPIDRADDRRGRDLWAAIRAAAGRPGGLEVPLPYGDFAELGNLIGPLTGVIAADIAALSEAGVARLTVAVRGLASWTAYPLNLYVAARCLSQPGLAAGPLVEDWCRGLYGESAADVQALLADWEAAMTRLWWLPRFEEDSAFRAWRGSVEGQAALEALTAAVERLDALGGRLADILAAARPDVIRARLERDQAMLALSGLHARLWLLRLQSHLGHPTLALHAAARELVTAARERLAALPLATCGSAFRGEFADLLEQFARWCGSEASG